VLLLVAVALVGLVVLLSLLVALVFVVMLDVALVLTVLVLDNVGVVSVGVLLILSVL